MRSGSNEDWKQVPGYPWYYEVSNFGRARSLARINARGSKIKTRYLSSPKAELTLVLEDGSRQWTSLAGLILRAFIGPPGPGRQVARHLDDDRKNNFLTNLAWGTDQDNHDDAVRNGRSFVSYGHLGKKHSEATKAAYSLLRKGVPTGHKMTKSHKLAILKGYRRKFPIKPMSPRASCSCGCGMLTSPGKFFVHGHSGRVRFRKLAKARLGKPRSW